MFRPAEASLWVLFISLVLGLGWSAPGEAQTGKHPITHQDLWLMKRVGAPAPSPDGKWVVFLLTEPAYDEKDQVADLWIVPGDGSGEPRRLTTGKGKETGAVWSEDSQRIAFSTKRDKDEEPQIYVLEVSGGEAVRVTNLATGAYSPQFSPDGKSLLFVSKVFRGAADDAANRKALDEREARKYKARAYDGFPIRYWDQWLDPDRQTHLWVQALPTNADASPPPRDLLAGTQLVGGAGFSGRWTDTSEELDGVWTPDGSGIVFAASTDRNAAAHAFTHSDLFEVKLRGGEPQRLTDGKDSWSQPRFSPDGRTLYADFERQTASTYSHDRIAALGWPVSGAPRLLAQDLDRSIAGFEVTPDSRQLYATAEEAGHENLFVVDAASGKQQRVIELTSGLYTNLAIPPRSAAPLLFATYESAVSPAEIVRIDPKAGTHAALTRFNTERAAQLDWLPVEEFWFTSSRGRRIHNMLVRPPAFDPVKKYPLFVLIHGGPFSMWRDQFFLRWNYHLIAAPGYVVLLTDYTGSTGYGEQFTRNIEGDPLKTPGDEINQAADEAIRRFSFIDGSRQCAGGASYGGHLSNWLQATTTRYRCLVSHAGMVNLESQWGTSDSIYHREIMNGGPPWEQNAIWRKQNPIRYAAHFRTPVLVTVGEHDFRVPMNNALEYWSALQRQQVPSRLIVFSDENHWILKGEDSRFFYSELHAWLARWLKP